MRPEKGNRARPGNLARGEIGASSSTLLTEEAVACSGEYLMIERPSRGAQRRVDARNAGINARVVFTVETEDGRPGVRKRSRLPRRAVECNPGAKIRRASSMLEHDAAAPAEADHSISTDSRRSRHTVLGCRRRAADYLEGIEPTNERSSGVHREAVRRDRRLSGEIIRRNGDEAISGKLVRNTADPGAQPENLMDDDHDGCIGAAFRIDHPDPDTVTAFDRYHRPLGVAGRGCEPCSHQLGSSRDGAIVHWDLSGDGSSGCRGWRHWNHGNRRGMIRMLVRRRLLDAAGQGHRTE